MNKPIGSSSDIVIAFVLIGIGTWAYSWFLSGIWLSWFSKKPKAA